MSQIDSNKLIDVLQKSTVGNDLTDQEMKLLEDVVEECRFTKGEDIIKEGTSSRDLFIIINGTVSVTLSLPMIHFNEQVIDELSENSVFGEFSFVTGKKRSASVIADSKVSLFKFRYSKLIELFDQQPRIGYVMMRNIAAIITLKIEENHKFSRKMMLGW